MDGWMDKCICALLKDLSVNLEVSLVHPYPYLILDQWLTFIKVFRGATSKLCSLDQERLHPPATTQRLNGYQIGQMHLMGLCSRTHCACDLHKIPIIQLIAA